jgi:hypothetical protein
MKKFTLALLLALPFTTLAASTKPNPAEFTITVHVLTSQAGVQYNGNRYSTQVLQTTIDHQPVELTYINFGFGGGVLSPGDYKARLSTGFQAPKQDSNGYDIYRSYDLLLPDGTTRTFTVTGLSLPSTNP